MATTRLAAYAPRMLLEGRPAVAQHWAAEGSLLFCDISGFTRLSEKLARQGKAGAEELVTSLSRIYTALLSATDDGGDLLKFSGDAMVIFYEGDEHAARAAHAGHGMRRVLAQVGSIATSQGQVRLRMSTGIHSGDFHFLLCGDDHLELLAAGPGVSSTVTMEATADAGEILLSPSTAAALPATQLGDAKGGGVLLRRSGPLDPVAAPAVPDVPDELAARFIPRLLRDRLGIDGADSDHRQATIAFLQFRGTDDVLAEHGPDDLFDRLQRLTVVVQQATARYDVCIIATDIDANGGKFMLAAGAPCATEDDEGRMIRACLDILAEDPPVPVRIGVNRGHIFGGDVGAPFRRTYSTMGDATNLAARIMGKAPDGQLLVHRSVLERAVERFDAAAVPPFTVKGKTAPVEASIVRGLATDEAPAAIAVPLVGREAELEALAEAASRTEDGPGVVIELVGDAGIGKTRILEALGGLAGRRPYLHLSCDPYGRATAYSAARQLLRDAFGIPRAASREETGHATMRLVRELTPQLEPFVSLLGPVLNADLPWTDAVEDVSDLFRRARMHAVATQLLAAARPEAVVTIDDATWMDEASAQLIADVLRRTRDRHWLVAIARRGEERGLRSDLGFRAEVVRVPPLSPAESRDLVQAASRDRPLPPRAVQAIVERGAGNPLFLVELATTVVEDVEGGLPSSVESVVTSRMDRLDIADRGVLRDLSVLGTVVRPDLLDAVLLDGVSRDERLWTRLAAFVARDDGGTVSFHSSLHRDAAYEGLTFARRRQLHAEVAAWLEGAGVEDLDAAPALSWHYHEAQRWDRSWTHSLRAAEQARSAFAHAEAARAYRRALVAGRRLSRDEEQLGQVAELLGDEEELAGRYLEAKAAYRQARRHLRDHALDRARLMHKEGVVEERVGRYQQSLRWYSRGLRVADAVREVRARASLRAEIEIAYAGVRFRQGRLGDCAVWCDRALRDATASDRVATVAHAYYLQEAAYGMLGDPRAEEVRGRSLPLYEQVGDLLGQGNVLNNLGITAYYGGRWDEALALYERSREAFTRVGDDVAAATAANNIAEILSDQGRLEPAEALLREALTVWRSVDYSIGVALAISNIGRLLLRAGQPEAALVELDEALRRFTELGSNAFVLETRVRRAEVRLALDDAVAALEEAAVVAATAEREGAGLLAASARRVEGLALIACGDAGAGTALLRTALSRAREAEADHEVALTLVALADHDVERRLEHRTEAAELLDRLGVADLSAVDVEPAGTPASLVPAGVGRRTASSEGW